MLLALIWAPVTSHCLLERLPGFEFLSCCAHEDAEASAPHETEDCSEDACAVVEEGFYKLQDNGDPVPKPVTVLVFLLDTALIEAPANGSDPDRARRAPPLLILKVSWQFFHRAAVPVRAPSLLA